MLRLSSEELPLEALRLSYALKAIPVSQIHEVSGKEGAAPVDVNAIAASLGMRARAFKQDAMKPVLELFDLDSSGFPLDDKVHQLFVNTRRSGNDEDFGPIVSRYLRLAFHEEVNVFVLPIVSRSGLKQKISYVFFSESRRPIKHALSVLTRIVVVSYNTTKHYREHKADGEITDYDFAWTKFIPGHYEILVEEDQNGYKKTFFQAEDLMDLVGLDLDSPLVDCLTGHSSEEPNKVSVKALEMALLIQDIKELVCSKNSHKSFQPNGLSNPYKSNAMQALYECQFLTPTIQHEILASLQKESAKLANANRSLARHYVNTYAQVAMESDKVTDAMSDFMLESLRNMGSQL
jgi:hypothetical protein